MKKNYLLSIIVIGLISLSLYSTYAMFTASVSTNDIVSLSASSLSTKTEIVEYERVTIGSKEKKVIEFTVSNKTNNSLYYGVWYEMIKPNVINDDIVIGKKEDTLNDSIGQLSNERNAKVSFVIENKTSSSIIINIGVGYSNTNSLNLPTNRYLITNIYKEILTGAEYIESLLPSNPETMNNDDPDGNVRYMGANPDNYVSFNNELWRIIGVFDVKSSENGQLEKRLKIIKSESLGEMLWDSNRKNNWETSSLKSSLNGYYLDKLTSSAKEQLADTYWNLGGSSTNKDVTASMFYERERGVNVYGSNPTYWIGKIGLMYPSDYGYATSGGGTTNRESCLSKELYNWPNDCKNNNYLYNFNLYQWTITHYSGSSSGAFQIYYNVDYNGVNIYGNVVSPSLYLKYSLQITGGDGTQENPYTLSQ